ncbi:MAG: hypothetical protein LHW59_09100 [Candidatus Cloacimonetes bacterium]|nr:hypothetical protein [Candidatus Cloacimonadota bacterium]
MKNRSTNQYLFVFLDIQGFSSICTESDDAEEKLIDSVFDLVSLTNAETQRMRSANDQSDFELNTGFFGDTVYMYQKCGDKNAASIYSILSLIQNIQSEALCKHNLFIRGGFSKGFLNFINRNPIGSAMVKAHDCSTKAGYSRTILEDCIFDELYNGLKEDVFQNNDDITKSFMCEIIKSDSLHYTTYLHCDPLSKTFNKKELCEQSRASVIATIQRYQKLLLIVGIDNSEVDKNHKRYLEFIGMYNDFCSKNHWNDFLITCTVYNKEIIFTI